MECMDHLIDFIHWNHFVIESVKAIEYFNSINQSGELENSSKIALLG